MRDSHHSNPLPSTALRAQFVDKKERHQSGKVVVNGDYPIVSKRKENKPITKGIYRSGRRVIDIREEETLNKKLKN